MGNEQSRSSKEPKQLNSPTSSLATASTGGLPASFSFLAKKHSNSATTKSLAGLTSSSTLVVVNDGTTASTSSAADPAADPDLRRIKEIPRFLPLLRGVLPGQRDGPEVHQKMDPRPVHRLLARLQHHLRQCAETVTSEQGRLFAHIVEIDQLTLSLVKKTALGAKRLDTLGAELKRADTLAEQLESTQVLFLELARSADSLNLMLPRGEQLQPLSAALTPLLVERRQRHFGGAEKGAEKGAENPVASAMVHLRVGDDGIEPGDSAAEQELLLAAGRVSECRVVDSEDGDNGGG